MACKSLKTSIKRWRIGDYLRQFSIVVAGIMVTFIGGNLISNCATQKEIKSNMGLIINELEQNREKLYVIKEKYIADRIMANYLIDSSFLIEKFNVDTLKKYNRFISNLSNFYYSDDAFDVLKNSSLMQKIDDKTLLLSLTETYKSLYETQMVMDEYYTLKSSLIQDIVLSTEDNYSIVHTWKNFFDGRVSMRSFCRIANRFVNKDYFDDQIEQLNMMIDKLKLIYQ